MLSSIWVTIINIVGGILFFANNLFEYMKKQELINQGKKEAQTDIIQQQQDIIKHQNDIIAKQQDKSETEKKLDSGTF